MQRYLSIFKMTCLVIAMLLTTSAVYLDQPAQAKTSASSKEAEGHRLYEEMRKLAQRNAWSGVDRAYQSLIKLKLPSYSPDAHMLGAQASRTAGDIAEALERYKKAGSQGQSEVQAIFGSFGLVKITKGKKKTLARSTSPFAADQRSAITFAQDNLKDKGKFNGWLPEGDYTLGAASFTVQSGQSLQTFKGK